MSDLDKKLREILLSDLFMDDLPANIHQEPLTKAHTEWAEQLVGKIKQAFTDAGYSTPVDKDAIINLGTEEQPILIHKDSLPFSPARDGGFIDIPKDLRLTGEEFYDRFEKELEAATKRTYADDIDYSLVAVRKYSIQVREAAKRAAGLKDAERRVKQSRERILSNRT